MASNYTFRGQVKVSDVQAAFDDFLNRINTMVSTFNATETAISSIDLTVGGPTLAAGGYCLTVGGIKQLLDAYDGCLIGCRAFRIDSNHIAVTDSGIEMLFNAEHFSKEQTPMVFIVFGILIVVNL